MSRRIAMLDEAAGNGLVAVFTDGFDRPDGAVGGRWVGAGNMTIEGRVAHITPVEGVELLTDPDLEGTYTLGKPATFSKGGSPTISQSAIVQHGAKAQQFQATAQTDFLRFGALTPSDNTHYVFKAHGRRNSGASSKVAIGFSQTAGYAGADIYNAMNSNFLYYEFNTRTQGIGAFQLFPLIERGVSGFDEVIIDNCSLKTLTHASLFKCIKGTTPLAKLSAKIYLPSPYIRGGVALCVDDPANPQNGVVAWCDRITMRLDKLLGGVWSTLFSTTTFAYVDFATLLPAFDGTNVTLSYNGIAIPAATTAVNDAAIINNKYHGIYALSPGIAFSGFGVAPIANTITLNSHNAVTVKSDTHYNAFPALIKSGSTLIGIYNLQNSHQDDVGVIVRRTSNDNGETWTPEVVIASEPLYSSQVAAMTKLASGDLIMPISRWDVAGVKHTNFSTVRSTDDGVTWAARIDVTTGFTSYSVAAGAIVELAGGNLLVAYYGRDIGDTKDSVRCSTSTDGGATWGSEKVIANGVVDNKNYHEPELILLSGTTVLCLIRSSDTGFIATSVSGDDGATWSAPVNKFTGNSTPHWCKMASGRIVVAVRFGTTQTRLFSSPDGLNWYPYYWVVDASGFQSMYAAPVDMGSGVAGCLFSLEILASKADMFFSRIPETALPQP